ncbi:MAG: glycoside hydrolase family 92 protein [Planctomycetes bacterium]|nr:glycoside hydrolase family 92 protein [Planctomycetota bacterium]
MRIFQILSFLALLNVAMADSSKLPPELRYADPFYGNAGVDMPPPQGVAAAWNWEKAQTGNTHPGAQAPFGMISVASYTGAYPTGVGFNKKTTGGKPRYTAKHKNGTRGFTHIHQSGTGAILFYYNMVRLLPMNSYGADNRYRLQPTADEKAHPGYYACTLSDSGIKVELSASSKVAHHRYHFPQGMDKPQVMIDFTEGGLEEREDNVTTVEAEKLGPNRVGGSFLYKGFPYFFVVESNAPYKNGNFYSLMGEKTTGSGAQEKGGKKSGKKGSKKGSKKADAKEAQPPEVNEGKASIKINKLRRKNCRMFYLDYVFDVEPGSTVELKVAVSFRSLDQAVKNLEASPSNFDKAQAAAESVWSNYLGRLPFKGGDEREKKLFYSNLYHSLVKPSICDNESPFWKEKPFVTDFSTLWDIYKSQLPLIIEYYPNDASKIIQSMILTIENHGYFPCGYMKSEEKGMKKFDGQCTGIEWVVLGYAYKFKNTLKGIDWGKVLKLSDSFEKLERVKTILETGAYPDFSLTHTLDVSSAFNALYYIAKGEGDAQRQKRYEGHREIWEKIYDANTGLMKKGKYYEGTEWNYSFRPHHSMKKRVELAGGKAGFTKLLDEFFGFTDLEKGVVSGKQSDSFERKKREFRFEGLNNECDMETPYAYQWSNKPERTKEVVEAVMKYQFAPGPYGLPGNNDSGGTSAWWVWNALGTFPLVEVLED